MTLKNPVNEVERSETVDRDTIRRLILTQANSLIRILHEAPSYLDAPPGEEDFVDVLCEQFAQAIRQSAIEFRRRNRERHTTPT